jgi:hypothetical protein
MIQLLGLEGYTGERVASARMVQEQILLLSAEGDANKELERRQKEEANG